MFANSPILVGEGNHMHIFINKYKRSVALIMAAILFIIDQLIKWGVSSNMKLFDSISIIPNVLSITYVQNNGAAFSIMSGSTIFLILITSLMLILAIGAIVLKKVSKYRFLITLSFIIAGGLGNLFDRIFRNFVIDYIDLKFWPMQNFAIFNFADCLIVVGVILFSVFLIYDEWKTYQHAKH